MVPGEPDPFNIIGSPSLRGRKSERFSLLLAMSKNKTYIVLMENFVSGSIDLDDDDDYRDYDSNTLVGYFTAQTESGAVKLAKKQFLDFEFPEKFVEESLSLYAVEVVQ